MTLAVNITGLASNDPVPGRYVQINFGVGPAGGSSEARSAILIGNKTSAGDATADTVVYGPASTLPLNTEQDAISRFGTGSELHRMYRRFRAVNRSTPLYAIAVAEAGGNTAATGTITFATASTGTATFEVWVEDEFVEVSTISGDSVATIAAAAVAQINSKSYWPVTATNVNGVITLLGRNGGVRGNYVRYYAVKVAGSTATTVTPGTSTACTGGATDDSYTTALSTISSSRYYYQVSASTFSDSSQGAGSTNFTALVAQVTAMALPTVGMRQRAFGAHVGSVANMATMAATSSINNERVEVVGLPTSDWPPCDLAAQWAGATALVELNDKGFNADDFGTTQATAAFWQVPAPVTQSAWLTRANLVTLLSSGITPIQGLQGGGSKVVSAITTKCLTSSVLDFRVRDRSIVSVEDAYADDVVAKWTLQFANKKIGDDPVPGASLPESSIVTPRVVKACIDQLSRDYGDAGQLTRVATTIADTQVGRDPGNTTRMNARIPLYVALPLHQMAAAIDDLSSAS